VNRYDLDRFGVRNNTGSRYSWQANAVAESTSLLDPKIIGVWEAAQSGGQSISHGLQESIGPWDIGGIAYGVGKLGFKGAAYAASRLAPQAAARVAANPAVARSVAAVAQGKDLLRSLQPFSAPVRGAADDLVIDVYGNLSRRTDIPGQAHHLNQDAAFRSRIAHADGVSVKLEGNAFRDVGSPHYNAHDSMESFWDIYRRGGMDAGNLPTNSQYNRALYNGLQESGLSPSEALRAVQAAKRQQLDAGLRGSDLVPRLPGRIGQAR